jgi:hypothetical protein
MSSGIGRFVRVTARICALLASAAIITAVSQVNMAVAGIGGIGGGGKGGGSRGHASLLEGETRDGSAGDAVAALSVFHLEDAIRSGKSESEIKALANEAGYTVAIT